MEAVARKYRDQVEFLFVYCREAHPEGQRPGRGTRTKQGRPIAQAATRIDREATARTFCEDMKMSRRILVDEFGDRSFQRVFGSLNNPTVVIDREGKIALKMAWTNGQLLDHFLQPFLAGGGKFDLALAQSVPVRGPGGRGQEMTVRMVERLLEGMELTEAETKPVREALRKKIESRGRLQQQAQALGELSRAKKTPEAEITKAVREFQTAVADYQKLAAELDRGLSARVSAKARAQLLAKGILENGLGFLGPGPSGPGPNASMRPLPERENRLPPKKGKEDPGEGR
jgi:hypothetical protein